MQSRCHARAAYLLSKGANDGLKNAEGLTCYEGLSAVCVRARAVALCGLAGLIVCRCRMMWRRRRIQQLLQ